MRGIAKAILAALLVSIGIMIFTNLVFFFPWYMTLVVETFNLSQIAASDNYIKKSYEDEILKRLRSRPFFNRLPEEISIEATNADGYSAISDHNDESYYADLPEIRKPYRQRGEPITVQIKATFPLSVQLWGKEYTSKIPVTFTLKTTGLKHYKDLDYYFDLDGAEPT